MAALKGMASGKGVNINEPRGAAEGASGVSGTRPATSLRRRVLLVEDEDMVRKVVTRMLLARGFQVHTAASMSQALALFDGNSNFEIDLLITDLMMPEGSGQVLARRLSERLADLRVLFVSGYSAAEHADWSPRRHRFLTKPFGSTELARAIDDLFGDELERA